jgi:transposase
MEPGDRVPREPSAAVGERSRRCGAGYNYHLRSMMMYSLIGRPSIPPERLLKSSQQMALRTVRSERMFCEKLDYNLLFRWFLDIDVTESSFDHSTLSRNRTRLLGHAVACEFFNRVVAKTGSLQLLSDEHFTIDGMLVGAWASPNRC